MPKCNVTILLHASDDITKYADVWEDNPQGWSQVSRDCMASGTIARFKVKDTSDRGLTHCVARDH